jgi:hypothetical protein
MYLNPPVNDLKELQERLENAEVFRVYKRPVNEKNRDRSYKKLGRSRIILGDGSDVTVTIFNGSVQLAKMTGIRDAESIKEGIIKMAKYAIIDDLKDHFAGRQKPETSFREFLREISEKEKEYERTGIPNDKVNDSIYNSLDLGPEIFLGPQNESTEK